MYTTTDSQRHLRVYDNRSEYHTAESSIEIFPEGLASNSARFRTRKIKDAFENGFLDILIKQLKNGEVICKNSSVSDTALKNLRELINELTSEVGRALIGLTVMQLCIKTIVPEQSIRLHKASLNRGSFSWVEGVSMRTLDKQYVTPILRKYDLVRLNADGFMMTRSLAENYPYSALYKAQLRGAREQWLAIVEELEKGSTDPRESLLYLLSLLLNAAGEFEQEVGKMLQLLERKIPTILCSSDVHWILSRHAESSDYAARLLEIGMHSLLQAATESGAFGDMSLLPLSQMRSANKKHGNVADVELAEGSDIVEAWDAKYGKSYLREEIEEAAEKIANHANLRTVGFVTNVESQRNFEINRRIQDLAQLYDVEFKIVTYEEWINDIFTRCINTGLITESALSQAWINCYAHSLGQKRRHVAPIDEPCLEWVKLLQIQLE